MAGRKGRKRVRAPEEPRRQQSESPPPRPVRAAPHQTPAWFQNDRRDLDHPNAGLAGEHAVRFWWSPGTTVIEEAPNPKNECHGQWFPINIPKKKQTTNATRSAQPVATDNASDSRPESEESGESREGGSSDQSPEQEDDGPPSVKI